MNVLLNSVKILYKWFIPVKWDGLFFFLKNCCLGDTKSLKCQNSKLPSVCFERLKHQSFSVTSSIEYNWSL